MESRARLAGHSIHQMLIVFPLGILGMSVAFDLIFATTSQPRWSQASFLMIGAGVIAGLIAAPFGLVDWLAIPTGTRAKAIGLIHGLVSITVVCLFAASWFLRRPAP